VSKLRKAANGQSCVRCGADDGTINLCHYSGPYQHKFGKGRGIKGADIAAADLCGQCHKFFDEYESQSGASEDWKVARSEEFLAACMLTVIRRIQQGIIKV
jgi:hypothetical protein